MAPAQRSSVGGRKYRQPNPTLNLVNIPPEIGQFAQQMKMNICHINTQRMYGPSFHVDQSWEPEPGSEVFVGRLPRDLFEPELVPFLEEVGPIYQLRMMMDFSGTNKGYCFVKYLNPEHAQLAVDMLNETQVRPGFPVAVSRSFDNHRLLLSGVPTSKTLAEVEQAIQQISGGVVNVELTWDVENPVTSSGIVFVTYSCHRAAALARKLMLCAPPLHMWGKIIIADWAEPVIQAHKNFRGSKVLLLKDFNPGTSWRLLMEYLNIIRVSGVKFIQMSRRGTLAYVFFHTRMQAEAAKPVLEGATFYGCLLRAEWWTPEKVPERSSRNNRPRCLLPVQEDRGELLPSGEDAGTNDSIEQQLPVEIPEAEIPEVGIPQGEILEVAPAVPAAISLPPYFQPYFAQPNCEYLPLYMPLPAHLPHDGFFTGISAFPEQSPAFWTVPVGQPAGYQPIYLGYPAEIASDWNGGAPIGNFNGVDGLWTMNWNFGGPVE